MKIISLKKYIMELDIMMQVNQVRCVYNDYYGAVEYYSAKTSWDDQGVSSGSNKRCDKGFIVLFFINYLNLLLMSLI